MRHVLRWQTGIEAPYFWLILLVVAHGLDIGTTAIGLRLGIPEDNPLLLAVLRAHGELMMYCLKIVLVASLFLAVQRATPRFRHAWVFFLAMSLPPIVVVANNVELITRLAS